MAEAGDDDDSNYVWETCKENVQPLTNGRDISVLRASLSSNDTDAADKERQHFEMLIRTTEAEDPLVNWLDYIKWTEEHYPSAGAKSHIQELLEKCTAQFANNDRYKQDERYIDVWVKYITRMPSRVAVFTTLKELYNAGVGTRVSILYELWSDCYLHEHNFKKAIGVLELGIKMKAVPVDSLASRVSSLQRHVAQQTAEQLQKGGFLDNLATSSDRSTLASLKVVSKNKAPVERASLSVAAGVVAQSCKQMSNSGSSNTVVHLSTAVDGGTTRPDQPTALQRQDCPAGKENKRDPGKWTAAKVPSAPVEASVHPPAFNVHLDERDIEAASSQDRAAADSGINVGCQQALQDVPVVPSTKPLCLGNKEFWNEVRDGITYVPYYSKTLVYGGIREFSLEELRALRQCHSLQVERQLAETVDRQREQAEIDRQKEEVRREKEELRVQQEDLQRVFRQIEEERNAIENARKESEADRRRMDGDLQGRCRRDRIAQTLAYDEPTYTHLFRKPPPVTSNTGLCSNEPDINDGRPLSTPPLTDSPPSSISRSSIMNLENKPACINTDNKSAGINKENKPAGINTENKPAGINTENKPAGINTENKPAGINTENKPAGINTENKPAGINTENKPASINTENKPAGINCSNPSSSITEIGNNSQHSKVLAPAFAIYRSPDNSRSKTTQESSEFVECPTFGGVVRQSDECPTLTESDECPTPRDSDVALVRVLSKAHLQEQAEASSPHQEQSGISSPTIHTAAALRNVMAGFENSLTIEWNPRYQEEDESILEHPVVPPSVPFAIFQDPIQTSDKPPSNVRSSDWLDTTFAPIDGSVGFDARARMISTPMNPSIQELPSFPASSIRPNVDDLLRKEKCEEPAREEERENDELVLSTIMELSKECYSSASSGSSKYASTNAHSYGWASNAHSTGHSNANSYGAAAQFNKTEEPRRGDTGQLRTRCLSAGDAVQKDSADEVVGVAVAHVEPVNDAGFPAVTRVAGFGTTFSVSSGAVSGLVERRSAAYGIHAMCDDSELELPVEMTRTRGVVFQGDPFSRDVCTALLRNLDTDHAMVRAQLVRFTERRFVSDAACPRIRVGHDFAVGSGSGREVYTVTGSLGVGGFARIYRARLVSAGEDARGFIINDIRDVALKLESPSKPWEFYIILEVHRRLQECSLDLTPCIIQLRTVYFFEKSSCIVSNVEASGTVLDVVNLYQKEKRNGLPEVLVALITLDLLTIVEQLHKIDIIHADIKPDNLLILYSISESVKRLGEPTYRPSSIQLIDFGRAIDMSLFDPGTTFVTRSNTSSSECPEMLEGRPWTYQADTYGVASTVYLMLFGEYLSVTGKKGEYRVKGSFKRWWKIPLWKKLFNDLINVPSCDNQPDISEMRCHLMDFLKDNSSTLLSKCNELAMKLA